MGCGASMEAPVVPFMQTVAGHLVNAGGQSGDAATVLSGKVKIVYFANHSSGYQFATANLMPFITRMKHKGSVPIETIFVSSDTDKEQFQHHLAMGPWWGVPWEDSMRRAALAQMFQVAGEPALVIVNEQDGLICTDGVQKLQADPDGEGFPTSWGTQQDEGGMGLGGMGAGLLGGAVMGEMLSDD